MRKGTIPNTDLKVKASSVSKETEKEREGPADGDIRAANR